MRILEVIHGYPPLYHAGSENYTETVSDELARKGHQVSVFSREENPFAKEYALTETRAETNQKIRKFTINIYRNKDRFLNENVDEVFQKVMDEVSPEVVHIEHLNHLSLGIPYIVKKRGVGTVYTLHDFWLMCPRGQFLQYNTEGNTWKNCDGQEDSKCASVCYSRYHTGEKLASDDVAYWTNWVNKRMDRVRRIVRGIDKFVSPSKTVMEIFKSYFPEAVGKVEYLDYGFDLNRLANRKRIRSNGNSFVFGYVGTHIPAKGIDYLIRSFSLLEGKPVLRIWGNERSEYTPYLKRLGKEAEGTQGNRIEWMGHFDSCRIIDQVFNKIDALVVPSIWLENSPLVIHEAQQARVPVITAEKGGMAEYVRHEKNGFLFKFREVKSLAQQMQRMINDPFGAAKLGKSGYLYSNSGNVSSIESHVETLMELFHRVNS